MNSYTYMPAKMIKQLLGSFLFVPSSTPELNALSYRIPQVYLRSRLRQFCCIVLRLKEKQEKEDSGFVSLVDGAKPLAAKWRCLQTILDAWNSVISFHELVVTSSMEELLLMYHCSIKRQYLYWCRVPRLASVGGDVHRIARFLSTNDSVLLRFRDSS